MMAGRDESPGGADRRENEPKRLARVSVRVAFDAALSGLAVSAAALAFGATISSLGSPPMLRTIGLTVGVFLLTLFAAGAWGSKRFETADLALRLATALASGAAVLGVIADLHGQDVLPPVQSLVAALFAFPV